MAPGRRVFFALWPTRRVRERLVAATRDAVASAGGRAVHPENYHITIAFLGEVDEPALDRLLAVPPVRTGPVDLALDRLGGFGRARVAWLAPTRMPSALTALEQVLWRRLENAGFKRETRPFRPHLTLARKARPVQGMLEPVRWRATRLALVESVAGVDGARYRPLAFWSLGRAFLPART
jgi:RNA 2',3'-cyclic 3'-phosphodiesterase